MRNFKKAVFYFFAALFVFFHATGVMQAAVGDQPRVYDLFQSGIRSCMNGDFDEGIRYFNTILTIEPDNYFAHLNRGIAYKDKNEFEKARADFNACIQIDPANPEAYFQLGNVSANQAEFETAVLHYTKAILVAPSLAKAFGARAIMHSNLLNYASAIDDINAAIAKIPEFPMFYIIRGQILELKGDCRAALYDFEKAMSFDPENFNTNIHMAWILSTCPDNDQRDGKKALTLARDKADSGDTHEALKILAAAYAETGDFPNAVSSIEKAIEKVKQITPAHRYEAVTLEKNHIDYENQRKAYQTQMPWRTKPRTLPAKKSP